MMEKFKSYFNLTLILILGWSFVGCQPSTKHSENNTVNEQPYILHLGQQGISDFVKYNDGKVDHQPAGASFRELDFSPPHLGKIRIENGPNSFVIDHIFSVLGTSFNQADGIQGLDIDAGLNKDEFVSPEQAYQGYVNLMKQLNQAGWKNYFYRSNARISIKDNIKYLLEWGDIIDPNYIFNYEEWKKIVISKRNGSLGYTLYANGVILKLSIDKTNEKDGKEQYMVRYAFDTVRYNQRNLMDDAEHNIDTYKMTATELEQAFKKELVLDKKARDIGEKEAISKGYHIDENYVDPDIWPYVK